MVLLPCSTCCGQCSGTPGIDYGSVITLGVNVTHSGAITPALYPDVGLSASDTNYFEGITQSSYSLNRQSVFFTTGGTYSNQNTTNLDEKRPAFALGLSGNNTEFSRRVSLRITLGRHLVFSIEMTCARFDGPTYTAQRIYFDVLNVFSPGFSSTPTAVVSLAMGQQGFSFPPLPTASTPGQSPAVGAFGNLLQVGVPFLPLRVFGTLRWRVNSSWPYTDTPIDFSVVSCPPIQDF